MNLSPLRKQVESLNKQMQSQNIQIKDLIHFLSKSTPKQALLKSKSSQQFMSKISNHKANLLQVKTYVDKQQNSMLKKQNRSSKSINELKHIRNKQIQIKLQSNAGRQALFKNDSFTSCGMTKSVTFHNMKNATMTRKYLKLSKPERKINTSCSLCKESVNTMKQSSKMDVLAQKRLYLQNCKKQIPKRQNSKRISDKQNKMVKSLSKRSNLSTPKRKPTEKANSDQKKGIKTFKPQLNSAKKRYYVIRIEKISELKRKSSEKQKQAIHLLRKKNFPKVFSQKMKNAKIRCQNQNTKTAERNMQLISNNLYSSIDIFPLSSSSWNL